MHQLISCKVTVRPIHELLDELKKDYLEKIGVQLDTLAPFFGTYCLQDKMIHTTPPTSPANVTAGNLLSIVWKTMHGCIEEAKSIDKKFMCSLRTNLYLQPKVGCLVGSLRPVRDDKLQAVAEEKLRDAWAAANMMHECLGALAEFIENLPVQAE